MAVLLTKRTKLVVRKDRVEGVLSLSPACLAWRPNNPNTAQAVDVATANMTGTQQPTPLSWLAPGTQSAARRASGAAALQKAKGKPLLRVPLIADALVLEFETEVDRDQVVDVLTPLMKQAAGPAPAGTVEWGAQLSGPLAAVKKQLLEEDKDLQQLFNQLVQGGVLSEADFWRGRQVQLQQRLHSGKGPTQRVGLSSVMLGHMQGSQDGRSNTVTLKLTPELVQQIFAEQPHVQRAHAALVPHSVDEKTFWSRFIKHEMAKRTTQTRLREARAAGRTAAQPTDDEEDPYGEFKDADGFQREARRMVRRVDPTVNLAADRYDGFRAQGDDRAAPPRDADGMFQDINRHAAVVLQGLPATQQASGGGASPLARPEDLRERAESALDDLRQPAAADVVALHISNPRRYFDSGGRTSSRDAVGSAAAGIVPPPRGRPLSTVLRAMEGVPLRNPPMNPAAAQKVLINISDHRATGRAGDWDVGGPWGARAPAEELVPQMRGLLRTTVLTCNELLRHFWASFPLTSAARKQRVQRLKTALCEQYDRTTAMQESAHGLERVHITQVLKPLRQALDVALA